MYTYIYSCVSNKFKYIVYNIHVYIYILHAAPSTEHLLRPITSSSKVTGQPSNKLWRAMFEAAHGRWDGCQTAAIRAAIRHVSSSMLCYSFLALKKLIFAYPILSHPTTLMCTIFVDKSSFPIFQITYFIGVRCPKKRQGACKATKHRCNLVHGDCSTPKEGWTKQADCAKRLETACCKPPKKNAGGFVPNGTHTDTNSMVETP